MTLRLRLPASIRACDANVVVVLSIWESWDNDSFAATGLSIARTANPQPKNKAEKSANITSIKSLLYRTRLKEFDPHKGDLSGIQRPGQVEQIDNRDLSARWKRMRRHKDRWFRRVLRNRS